MAEAEALWYAQLVSTGSGYVCVKTTDSRWQKGRIGNRVIYCSEWSGVIHVQYKQHLAEISTRSDQLHRFRSWHCIFTLINGANLVLERLSERYLTDSLVSSSILCCVAMRKLGKPQQTWFGSVSTAAPAQQSHTGWKTHHIRAQAARLLQVRIALQR